MTRECLAQEWRERLEDFAVSEMTVQEWCDFNRVAVHQYYYWRRRLNNTQTQPTTTTQWMPVQIRDNPAPSKPTTPLTIHIAGAAIQVTPGFDPDMLRDVVKALAVLAC